MLLKNNCNTFLASKLEMEEIRCSKLSSNKDILTVLSLLLSQ